MAYQGVYKVKNTKKYNGDFTNVIYRSMWERNCFRWCDENPSVKSWSSEETVIPYFYDVDKKYHRYYVDLKITFTNGKTYLIEIKPAKETAPPKFNGKKTKRYINEGLTYVKNMNKWKAANEYAKDRGWEFHVWTENTLSEMGLLPKKTPKRLKPLPTMKKKKKVTKKK